MLKVEQEVRKLIERKALHIKKGTIMGQETWTQMIDHLYEEVEELTEATEYRQPVLDNPNSTPKQKKGAADHVLEELGDLFGLVVHAALKSGFTMEEVEAAELAKLKLRFTQ